MRRICVFMGRGEVAKSCLKWLVEQNYPVSKAIVIEENFDIRELCHQSQIDYEVFDPNSQNLSEDFFILISLWFPRKIGKIDLDRVKKTLNIHPGIVPMYRGNDSATWSIIHGGPYGVTLLEMNSKIDAGGVWAEKKLEVPPTISGGNLLVLLKSSAIELFCSCFDDIYTGKISPVQQHGESRTFTREMTNINRRKKIQDFQSVQEFVTWARAHNHGPDYFGELEFNEMVWKVNLQLENVSHY